MKTMTVFEARNNFSRTLEAAKRDVVVVTRNGRPVAAIQAIDDTMTSRTFSSSAHRRSGT